MQFRILGPLEVVDDRGVVALGGIKPRAVLAMLLLRANAPVSAEALALGLWGEEVPGRSVNRVHVHVSRLRKALGGGDTLTSTLAGYRLRVEPGELDAERFDALVQSGRQALAAGRPDAAAATLREALDLWRGPPLAELAFEPFAHDEIRRLEEKRLSALEARVDAELAAGRHDTLIAELQQLADAHPTRERLAAQLIVALYRCGRQAEALDAYRHARTVLVERLGLEPGSELRALERRVLNQDPALDLPPARAPRLAERTHDEPAAPAPADGELPGTAVVRKTVTVLVATLRAHRADPEAAWQLMLPARKEAVRIIARRGGVEGPRVGVDVVAVFGLESAHEDDALRALMAAGEVRERLTSLTDGDLGLGIAVDTGMVVAEDATSPESLFGPPLDRARMLARSAGDGEILLGDATRALAPDAIRVERRSPDTWRLSALIPNAPAVVHRHATPLVNRHAELETALAAFERVAGERSAQLLIVTGEAGLGKSRLAHELRRRIADRATTFVAHCGAFGDGSSLWPLRQVVADLAGGTSRDAVRRMLGDAEDADAVADLVVAGLGLGEQPADPELVPWAIRRLLETAAEQGPLVLVVEDAHAAEPALLDLLEYLVEWLTSAPVLVHCLARPELLERRGAWLGGQATVIRLAPLVESDASRLLENLAGRRAVEPSGRREVLRAAEGNPLFIEQMLAMRTEGASGGPHGIPATIHAVLAARLDGLDRRDRAVIERAAIVGRQFDAATVAELLPADLRPSAGQSLRELVHRGLIRPDRSRVPGHDVLRFHHILIRDVAYATCAKTVRSRVHEQLADILARREENLDEAIGHHYEQAFAYRQELSRDDHDARRLAAAAAERLEAVGRRTLARGDVCAARAILRRAANLHRAAGDPRPDVELALGRALADSGDFNAARRTLRKVEKAARRAGEETLVAKALMERSHACLFADPHPALEEMRETAEEAMRIFERSRDDQGLAGALNHIAFLHWARLETRQVEETLQRSLKLARRPEERSEAFNLLLRATVVGRCRVDVGIRRCEAVRQEMAAGATINAAVDVTQAVLEAMRMRFDVARRLAQAARARLEELGLGLQLAGLEIYAAMVELLAGDASAARPALERACAEMERLGERGRLPTALAFLARVRYEEGDYDAVLELTARSRELSYGDDVASRLLWSGIRGRALARLGARAEAEEAAALSLALARRTDADQLIAQAMGDLADVRAQAGRPGEAAALLDEAVALYAAKGDEASARRAGAMRDDLSPANGATRAEPVGGAAAPG